MRLDPKALLARRAGIRNAFFRIGPKRGIRVTLTMQFCPFCGKEAMGPLHHFERSAYTTLG